MDDKILEKKIDLLYRLHFEDRNNDGIDFRNL